MFRLLVGGIVAAAVSMTLLASDSVPDELKKFPNVDYLAYGYNMYLGNPHTLIGNVDPGFTEQIFNFSYELNRTTYDKRFQIPDEAHFKVNYGCYLDFDSTLIEKASDFSNSFAVDVKAGGGFQEPEANYSASLDVGYRGIFNGTEH